MSVAVKFEDESCASLSFPSSWRHQIKTSSADTQTPEEMFQFEDAETQSGLYTEVVEEVVGKKDTSFTLLDFLSEYRENRTREVWEEMIVAGKATIDGEVVVNPHASLEAEQYVEVVNESVSVQTEILKCDFGVQAGDSEDDIGKFDKELSESTGIAVSAFLSKVVPDIEAVLEENSSSTAFGGYFMNRRIEGPKDEAVLWRTLSVDLEKHKVIYPDWSKGQHFTGIVVNRHVTRNKERIYDIDISDGARLMNVREEYIRAIVTPSGMHSPTTGGRGGRLSGGGNQQQFYYEGMRLHACVKRGANPKASLTYLPGRVTKAHRNGSVDVECEGGVTKLGLVSDDLLVGLSEGQEVEARKPLLTPLQCTDVSWSCNGSIVAASYGRLELQGWCDSPGAVCTWSLFGREFQENQPTCILDHNVSLMCVNFHPEKPSLLAAGSFNGEVIVWDLNTPETAIKISPISDSSHSDPVMSLSWVFDTPSQSYLLASLGADGKLLLWNMESDFCTPHKGAVLSNANATAKRGGTYPSAHGGTALAFATGYSVKRPKWVLAGQEGGTIVRAQASRILNATDTSGKNTKTGNKYPSLRHRGENFSHEAHIGPVTSIECSPFHRNLFLTGGQDGSVRLYHLLETSALYQWEPVPPPEKLDVDISFAPICCVSFSQTRPAVFAAASQDGFVYIFDLLVSKSGPVVVIEVENWSGGKKSGSNSAARSNSRVRISGLAFNKKQRDLLAVCDDAGRILVYRLGWDIANKVGPQEQSLLDHLGHVSSDD